jgi:farnesyl diphosphate synthase
VTTPKVEFHAWMAEIQQRVERALDRYLPPISHAPERLHQAMRYAVLGGGKRVRPLLAFAAGDLVQAPHDRLDAVACAVELIHAYSLVHDDLPCMDDDTLRRGKPTVHVEFDEATAMLVGDSLQALAFELLATGRIADEAATQLEMVRSVARASGTRGMAGGQALDLAAVGATLTLPELEFMHILKTGALIRAAVMLGARCGQPLETVEFQHLDRYAKCVGLAFQVIDDVLDAETPTATLGKTAGKDAARGKPTYVSVLGVGRARELAQELRRDALSALDGFGAKAVCLRDLANFVVLREF